MGPLCSCKRMNSSSPVLRTRIHINSAQHRSPTRHNMVSHVVSQAPSPAAATPSIVPAAANSSQQAAGAKVLESQQDWQAYNQRWFDIWQGGLQPGQYFDKGSCNPQFQQLLATGQLDVRGKRALVPGCGRGYDVFAFAAAGAAAAVGLDFCPLAIAAATAEREVALAHDPAAAERCQLLAADFFDFARQTALAARAAASEDAAAHAVEQQQQQPPFDVGYDYTFLCALHPDMRADWAASWARLLNPGGELVTMIYPVDSSLGEGPPWPVTPELYQQLLLPAGFELMQLLQIPASMSHPSRAGREWLGRWRRTDSDG